MSREIVQSLLTLKGIEGVIFAGRRSRAYFYGIESILDRTKQMLAQGVIQVLENIPETFDSFMFQFSTNTVYLYKLEHGTVLIIVTTPELQQREYQQIISKLKQLFRADPYQTTNIIKQLIGTTSSPSLTTQPTPPPSTTPTAPVAPTYQLKELLDQLNYLSNFTAQFLGKMVVANYWKATRPQTIWLSEFDIDRYAQISHPHPGIGCTEDQYQELREWTKNYLKRCKQVIRNLDQIIKEETQKNTKLKLIL
ncbi:MAG: hypothetical protein ACK4QL_09910 [Pseudanabaenaceae cyanobacterium]